MPNAVAVSAWAWESVRTSRRKSARLGAASGDPFNSDSAAFPEGEARIHEPRRVPRRGRGQGRAELIRTAEPPYSAELVPIPCRRCVLTSPRCTSSCRSLLPAVETPCPFRAASRDRISRGVSPCPPTDPCTPQSAPDRTGWSSPAPVAVSCTRSRCVAPPVLRGNVSSMSMRPRPKPYSRTTRPPPLAMRCRNAWSSNCAPASS